MNLQDYSKLSIQEQYTLLTEMLKHHTKVCTHFVCNYDIITNAYFDFGWSDINDTPVVPFGSYEDALEYVKAKVLRALDSGEDVAKWAYEYGLDVPEARAYGVLLRRKQEKRAKLLRELAELDTEYD